MKIQKWIFLFATLAVVKNTYADISRWNVAELIIEQQRYFMAIGDFDGYLDEELCYYNYQGKYIKDALDFIKEALERSDQKLYKELHIISLEKFPSYQEVGEKDLYILKKKLKVTATNYNGKI